MKVLILLLSAVLLAKTSAQAAGGDSLANQLTEISDLQAFINARDNIANVRDIVDDILFQYSDLTENTVIQLTLFSENLQLQLPFVNRLIQGVNDGRLDSIILNSDEKQAASSLVLAAEDTIAEIQNRANPTILLNTQAYNQLEADIQRLNIAFDQYNEFLINTNIEVSGDREPHFIYTRKNTKFCFDFSGDDGNVVQLLSDLLGDVLSETRLTVNGRLFSPGQQEDGQPINTYFSDVKLMIADTSVVASRANVTVNNAITLRWYVKDRYDNGRFMVDSDGRGRVDIVFLGVDGEPVALSVFHHEGPIVRHYLGVSLTDMRGLSLDAQGLLGEFKHNVLQVAGDSSLVGNQGTLFNLENPSENLDNAPRLMLVDRFNTPIRGRSHCWYVPTMGSRLLNCNYLDYFVNDQDISFQGMVMGIRECLMTESLGTFNNQVVQSPNAF